MFHIRISEDSRKKLEWYIRVTRILYPGTDRFVSVSRGIECMVSDWASTVELPSKPSSIQLGVSAVSMEVER